MRARDRMLIAAAGVLGPVWIRHRRGVYREVGAPIGGEDARVLARYFSAPVLACVRVAVVERVEEAWVFEVMRAVGARLPVEMGTVSGMAFGDAVVLARGAGLSTLFHEMVHVVQYRALGLGGFAREYVKGWVESGSYEGIALERVVFEMQRRFDLGEEFEVEEEIV